MTLSCCRAKKIAYTGGYPFIRIGRESREGSDMIRSLEAYSFYLVTKPVRVIFDDIIDLLFITVIDTEGKPHRDPEFLKIHTGIPYAPVLHHLYRKLLGHPHRDAAYLRKSFGLHLHLLDTEDDRSLIDVFFEDKRVKRGGSYD